MRLTPGGKKLTPNETQTGSAPTENRAKQINTKRGLKDFTIPRTGGRTGAPSREGQKPPAEVKPRQDRKSRRSRSRKRKRTPEPTATSTAPNTDPQGSNKKHKNKVGKPSSTDRKPQSRSRKRQPNHSRPQQAHTADKENTAKGVTSSEKKWQLISLLLDKI